MALVRGMNLATVCGVLLGASCAAPLATPASWAAARTASGAPGAQNSASDAGSHSGASTPKTPAKNSESLERALQLARAHHFPEADAALRGVPPPTATDARIAYFRLKAGIASGLGRRPRPPTIRRLRPSSRPAIPIFGSAPPSLDSQRKRNPTRT